MSIFSFKPFHNNTWNRIALLLGLVLSNSTVAAENMDFSLSAATEHRTFTESGKYPDQLSTYQPSLELEPELSFYKDDLSVHFNPFIRLDAKDDHRSYFEAEEAYIQWQRGDLSFKAGQAVVFWGVTESLHLVDVINQWNAREDIDREDKLGQPMIEVAFSSTWGELSVYYLPAFRERPFPGPNGRFRLPLPIAEDIIFNEDKTDFGNPDLAVRYSHFTGNWDVGLSLFHGLDRTPKLLPTEDGSELSASYHQMTQIGIDLQLTEEAWLWKLEAIYKETDMDDYLAFVGGVEYTLFGLMDGVADLGLLLEFQYDGRSDDPAISPRVIEDNDLFIGARYAFNDAWDTAILAGIVSDVNDGSMYGFSEASRRIGEDWTIELEGRFIFKSEDENILSTFENDSVITARLSYYF